MSRKEKRQGPRGTPYRGGAPTRVPEQVEESGLIGEIIRQFADPLAFYRELVQNAIDAGATEIVVQLVAEEDEDGRSIVRVSVRDDGSGMSREVLEEELTVLFRSTKESRQDAIGKFGIGFVSVLGVSPEIVIVDTSTGDRVRWTLYLRPDQTYELFRADGVPAEKGTTVTLHVPVPAGELEAFAARSEQALRRWCRHARIPIRFLVLGTRGEASPREVRIDEPFSLDAVVSVQAQSRDGTLAIVGLPRAGQHYAAFYNQGLLLHETREHELGAVAFKVLDARLEHTLSRDNVRRDENYDRAIAWVRNTLSGPLTEAVVRELAQAAEAYARGAETAGPRYLEIVGALKNAERSLRGSQVTVPVVPGRDGQRVRDLGSAELVYVSYEGRTGLATALATAGEIVIDARFAASEPWFAHWLEDSCGLIVRKPGDAFAWVVPVEHTSLDQRLLARVGDLLAEAWRRPSAIVLADVEGYGSDRLALAGLSQNMPALVPASAADADPFRLLSRPPLVLRASHPIVAAARARAASAPALAAGLLARAAVIALGGRSDRRLEILTAAALRAVPGGSL